MDSYRADCLDCPGTPPVGLGRTKVEALAALFYVMLFDSTDGSESKNWTQYINKNEPIIINGKLWNRDFKKAT